MVADIAEAVAYFCLGAMLEVVVLLTLVML